MSYDDWLREFTDVFFCHLYPDAVTDEAAVDMVRHNVPSLESKIEMTFSFLIYFFYMLMHGKTNSPRLRGCCLCRIKRKSHQWKIVFKSCVKLQVFLLMLNSLKRQSIMELTTWQALDFILGDNSVVVPTLVSNAWYICSVTQYIRNKPNVIYLVWFFQFFPLPNSTYWLEAKCWHIYVNLEQSIE